MPEKQRYTVDTDKRPEHVIDDILPHVIVVGNHPVIDRKPNGQQFYMTYRTLSGARKALNYVLPELPNAEVRTLA